MHTGHLYKFLKGFELIYMSITLEIITYSVYNRKFFIVGMIDRVQNAVKVIGLMEKSIVLSWPNAVSCIYWGYGC